jgi:hypothetical protein
MARRSQLFLVTRGAQPVIDGDEISLTQAAVWGLGRTIALEHPELRCIRIDVSHDIAADALVQELLSPTREDQIALRDQARYVARLVRPAVKPHTSVTPVAPDATYLITGGLGGVGSTVARWFVERGARHLALIGRFRAQ